MNKVILLKRDQILLFTYAISRLSVFVFSIMNETFNLMLVSAGISTVVFIALLIDLIIYYMKVKNNCAYGGVVEFGPKNIVIILSCIIVIDLLLFGCNKIFGAIVASVACCVLYVVMYFLLFKCKK